MGKRKIPIEKIEKQASRDVTFSKRRKGLFHKALELSILCGAKNAVIVISRAGNPFTFGDPSVEELVNHYRNGTRPPTSSSSITTPNHKAAHNYDNIPSPVANYNIADPESPETTTTKEEEQLLWWDMLNVDETDSEAELRHYRDLLIQEKENIVRMNQTTSPPSNEILSAASSHVDQTLILGGEGSTTQDGPLYLTNDCAWKEIDQVPNSNNVVESDELTWGEFDEIMALLEESPCDNNDAGW